LPLEKGRFWDWSGAGELTCDATNPTAVPLELKLRVAYRDDAKRQVAEWPFMVPAVASKRLRCEMKNTRIDFGKVSSMDIRITRLPRRVLVVYPDRLFLSGNFGPSRPMP